MANPELLIGLLAIALAAFFGLWGFRKDIIKDLSAIKEAVKDLSNIKEAVVAIRTTVEKTWDLALRQSGAGSGTVERELENLGKVKITAEPAKDQTIYTIEMEKPLLKEEFFFKVTGPDFVKEETKILGGEGKTIFLSAHRMRYYLPSTDSKLCTQFITFFLKWLNSTYVESLKDIKKFEEPILT